MPVTNDSDNVQQYHSNTQCTAIATFLFLVDTSLLTMRN